MSTARKHLSIVQAAANGSVVNAARRRRLQLKQDRTKHGSANSYRLDVEQIPPEIWIKIFFFCLPNDFYVTPSLRNAPILLTQVHKRWKAICCASPELWTSVSIVLKTGRPRYTAMVEAWLAHCPIQPLFVQLKSPVWNNPVAVEDDREFGVLLHTITNSTQRWKAAHLILDSWPNLVLKRLFVNPMPLLESLAIKSSSWPRTVNLADFAPNLVRFFSLAWPVEQFYIDLHWDRLTHLHCDSWVDGRMFIGILECTTSLIALSIEVSSGASRNVKPVVSHLRSMTIRPMIFVDGESLLNLVTLPGLREIEIRNNNRPWPHAALAELFVRSGCLVEWLSLKNADVGDELLQLVRRQTSLLKVDVAVSLGRPNLSIMERVKDVLWERRVTTPGTTGNVMECCTYVRPLF